MPEAIEARMDSSPTDLSSVADRVEDGERVVIKIGTKEFAVISMEDLEFLEEVENNLDLLSALEGATHTLMKTENLSLWRKSSGMLLKL